MEQAASAATVVALAASEVTLVADGEFLIHDPFIRPDGFAGYQRITVADLKLAIAQVSEALELLLDIYTKRTAARRETVGELMRLTTFLKPEDALRRGFIDRIVPALPKPEPTDDVCSYADCPRRVKADVVH